MSKTFLITGGAGFIGTNLCEFLIQEGNRVIVVDNLCAGTNPDRLPEEVEFHNVDIRETSSLTKLCAGVDVVIHLAALPSVQYSIDNPKDSHDVNVTGTLSVLEAARASQVKRVVFAASSAAYGDQETMPLTTDLLAQPKSPYALHKYAGEHMMHLWSSLYDLETVSLRFFNVYGPHIDPEGPYALVIGRFLKQLASGQPLTVTGDGLQTRDFIHVRDVVRAISKASTVDSVGKGEVLNVGSGVQTTIKDLAEMVGGEITFVDPRIEPRHTLADIAETKERLDWEPCESLDAGVDELKISFSITN